MESLQRPCSVWDEVFGSSLRRTVSDLTDLIEDRINAHHFFETDHVTDVMRTLPREAFDRFSRRSNQGMFVHT
ncbi:MAG: hypothetical protein GVY15_00385 [Bacteroidetes bacterium]|jgi:hypothetical protein|nr:hypothetical protein [Bacteroidota bacterium]